VIFAIMADEPIVAFTICPEKRNPHSDHNDPVFQIACFHPGTLRLAAGASFCDDAGLEHIISHHRTLYIDNMAAHVEVCLLCTVWPPEMRWPHRLQLDAQGILLCQNKHLYRQ